MRALLPASTALALVVGLAAAPAAIAAPADAPRLVVRRDGLAPIGAATFDAARSAIELPFAGRAPRAFLYRLSPTHYYYEFEGARFAPGGAQYRKLDSTVVRYKIADRPHRPVVRVSFRVSRASVPAVKVDPATRTITVLPLGREAALGSAPLSVPHGWSLPLDRAPDRLTAAR